MSDRSSPINGYEAGATEPAMRLKVRKDLFPEERLPRSVPEDPDAAADEDDLEGVSCVKLETDFEQSIDDIAIQKQLVVNGSIPAPEKPRKLKHYSRRSGERSKTANGCLSSEKKRRKSSPVSHPHRTSHRTVPARVKGGKNLNLVSSSECQDEDEDEDEDDEEEEEEESSEDEVLMFSVKLPLISVPRQTGKPYSHELSQLSSKKSKSKDSYKERRIHTVTPCSGKPRSMLDICSSRSKKKSKKSDSTATYRSQIVDTNNKLKIKIRKTSFPVQELQVQVPPTPVSIADIGQRKSKKKRAASPDPSESSGEEYDPSRGDSATIIRVAPAKTKHPPSKAKKSNKKKNEKTEKAKVSAAQSKETGPQSPWAQALPEEVLARIFEYVVASQGTLPSVIRLGRVCRLWHVASCRSELWKSVDLSQYTKEKCKTDYKLVWLLENRLSMCHTLNIAHWKVGNMPWVLACLADYCPLLTELSVAGWSRLTADQLYDLFQTLPKLQRLDLSHTTETGGSGTCLSAASVARVVESFGDRLTHLTLANNMFTSLQQILLSIAAHCPNLEVLDISGARATSHPAAIPLEALQKGCPRVRVFRAANAQLVLAHATTLQQKEVTGWSHLEELSIAGEAASERVNVGEYRLNDEALARLVRDATRLRLLDVRGLARLSDSGLVRVPAWELQHLFLGGCNVLRQSNACLELICEKWSHSLIEIDLSWASATKAVDGAVFALAESSDSKLRILNLCGSSVSFEPVKKALLRCHLIESINLSSCRALPRGMKRLYTGKELQDLKDSLDPTKPKTKDDETTEKKKKDVKKTEADSKSCAAESSKQKQLDTKVASKTEDLSSSSVFQEPKSVPETNERQTAIDMPAKTSPDSKSSQGGSTPGSDGKISRDNTPQLLSPIVQSKPDSSSTPRSESSKADGSPYFSPVAKPDSQAQTSPDVAPESVKSNNSWSLGQFKTTPTHKSEASPLNKMDCREHVKIKHSSKVIEQCSPTTSQETKPSPDTPPSLKQDMKTPSHWNLGSYSPMPRQDSQFSSQSPYSAQPSPAQPSPYSAQPSPYSTQPSPYSSQPSPYSAQPSPDTSQIVKPDIQKSNSAWNTGSYSPMTKHPAPFSPEPALNVKDNSLRSNPNKTPGQYSPMSRQDRIHQSPYSPRPSVDSVAYSNKKSPGVGSYSPLMRQDCHLPSSDAQTSRSMMSGRSQDMYGRQVSKPETTQSVSLPEMPGAWGMDRFNQLNTPTSSLESFVWGNAAYADAPLPDHAALDHIPAMLNTSQQPQTWSGLPSFDTSVRRPSDDISDPWTSGHFRVEPPHQVHNTFVEHAVNFESLSAHIGQQSHMQSFLDEAFSEASRVD